MKRLLVAVAFGITWMSSPTADAQPTKKPPAKLDPKTAEAKRLFDEGADLYTRGSYEEAITSWEKSYEISKRPLIFESIANAYERLGDPKKAREYLQRWRAAAPPDEYELLDARLKKLDERIAKEEDLEAKRRAEEEASAKARQPVERTEPPLSARPITSSDTPVLGYVLAGGGLAAVTVGITLDLIAAARRPDETSACKAVSDRQVCTAASQGSIESSNALATVGDVLWIAGGIAAVTGGVLIFTHKANTAAAPRTSFAPIVAPTGGGLSVLRRF